MVGGERCYDGADAGLAGCKRKASSEVSPIFRQPVASAVPPASAAANAVQTASMQPMQASQLPLECSGGRQSTGNPGRPSQTTIGRPSATPASLRGDSLMTGGEQRGRVQVDQSASQGAEAAAIKVT